MSYEKLPSYYGSEHLTPEATRFFENYDRAAKKNGSFRSDCTPSSTPPMPFPLQIWIVKCPGDNDSDLPTEQDIQTLLGGLNALYQNNGINIRYYTTCIQTNNATDITTLTTVEVDSPDDHKALVEKVGFNDKAFNIYIVNSTLSLNGEVTDGQHLPTALTGALNKEFIVLRRVATNLAPTYSATTAHELGHFWGLQHTHMNTSTVTVPFGASTNPNLIERVDGKNSKKAGDMLEDTPADPQLNRQGVEVSNCTNYSFSPLLGGVIGDLVDCKGKSFKPDVKNIMSYTPRECMKTFSPKQRTIIQNAMAKSSLFNTFSASSDILPDNYDPDNEAKSATLIKDGETQCHNFHKLAEECSDEVDWFKIDTKDGSLGVFNFVIEGQKSYFVGDVTVYAMQDNGERGSQLSATIAHSGPIVSVTIPCDLIGESKGILIEVKTGKDLPQNKDIKDVYTATLTVYESIPLIMGCKDGEVTIENIPNDAAVSWSTPKGASYFLVSSQNFSTTVLNIPSDGVVTLIATIKKGGCQKTVTQTIMMLPQGGKLINSFKGWIGGSCKEPEFNFDATLLYPGTHIDWDIVCTGCKNQALPVISGTTASLNVDYDGKGSTISVEATIKVSDDCGNVETQTVRLKYGKVCPKGGTELQVNPNPARDQIEVFIEPSEDTSSDPNDPIKYEVLITNPYNGAIKYFEKEIESGKTTVPLYNFEVGVYHLQVNTGKEILNKTFVVQD